MLPNRNKNRRMEQGEVLGIRVDGDAWSNRLTRLMAMHKAIDLQKGGWIRAGSVRFWKNDYSTLDRGFDLVLKWLSNVHFNSCINRWIKNERILYISWERDTFVMNGDCSWQTNNNNTCLKHHTSRPQLIKQVRYKQVYNRIK